MSKREVRGDVAPIVASFRHVLSDHGNDLKFLMQ